MVIKTEVFAEDVSSNDRYLAVTANLVFVGLDKNNKTVKIQQMEIPSNPYYRMEYEQAQRRHKNRKR